MTPDLEDRFGSIAAEFRRVKSVIRQRYAELHLSEREVQGLLVAAFWLSTSGVKGQVDTLRTVAKWRKRKRVGMWLLVGEDRQAIRTQRERAARQLYAQQHPPGWWKTRSA